MARFDTRTLGSWEQDLSALVGSLIHEVKNPLSTMMINAQLLMEEWEQPSTPKEARAVKRLGVVRAEITRIEDIFRSFLRFTEKKELALEAHDLNRALVEILDRNVEAWDRQGIRVRFQSDAELAPFQFDASLIEQALLNLLRNAAQAMPEGGELIVLTRREAQGAVVEIIDTGEGIAADRMEKIFRPYFSSKSDGNGLGLPTTLRIIESHGGHLTVESEVGTGSRFMMVLPGVPAERDSAGVGV